MIALVLWKSWQPSLLEVIDSFCFSSITKFGTIKTLFAKRFFAKRFSDLFCWCKEGSNFFELWQQHNQLKTMEVNEILPDIYRDKYIYSNLNSLIKFSTSNRHQTQRYPPMGHLTNDQEDFPMSMHGSKALSNKKCYIQYSCINAGLFILHSIIEYHMWKILKVKTRLAHIVYYKSLIVVDSCHYLLLLKTLVILILFIQSLFKEY